MTLVGGDVDLLMVHEADFDRIREGGSTSALDHTFLGVTAGGLITLVMTLWATDLPAVTRGHMQWAALGAAVLVAFFLARVILAQRQQSRLAERIKRGRRHQLVSEGQLNLPPFV
ncbi:MAG: hypothetical protein U0893_19520 [Chloroflexota bacterium]